MEVIQEVNSPNKANNINGDGLHFVNTTREHEEVYNSSADSQTLLTGKNCAYGQISTLSFSSEAKKDDNSLKKGNNSERLNASGDNEDVCFNSPDTKTLQTGRICALQATNKI